MNFQSLSFDQVYSTLGEFPSEMQVTVSIRKHFVNLIKLCHLYARRHLLPVKLVLQNPVMILIHVQLPE